MRECPLQHEFKGFYDEMLEEFTVELHTTNLETHFPSTVKRVRFRQVPRPSLKGKSNVNQLVEIGINGT